MQFYDATLGLQASFSPAQERLHAIQCEQALPTPKPVKVGGGGNKKTNNK